MAARKRAKRAKDTQPDLLMTQLALYACSHCARQLQVEMVVSADVERLYGVATGYILFEHFCPCERGTVRVSRRFGSYQSFVTLFGTQPALPYRAPFSFQGVEDDDPAVTRWQRQLQQVNDYDEFMRLLGAA